MELAIRFLREQEGQRCSHTAPRAEYENANKKDGIRISFVEGAIDYVLRDSERYKDARTTPTAEYETDDQPMELALRF